MREVGYLVSAVGGLVYVVFFLRSCAYIVRAAPSKRRGMLSLLNSSRHFSTPHMGGMVLGFFVALAGGALTSVGSQA